MYDRSFGTIAADSGSAEELSLLVWQVLRASRRQSAYRLYSFFSGKIFLPEFRAGQKLPEFDLFGELSIFA